MKLLSNDLLIEYGFVRNNLKTCNIYKYSRMLLYFVVFKNLRY